MAERDTAPAVTTSTGVFTLANQLTLDAMDNISKEPDYKKCAVRVEVA